MRLRALSVTVTGAILAVAGQQSAVAAPFDELEEVIITVQKRSQTVQDTPAAVTAIGGDMAATRGVSELAAIQNLVPSVRLQKQSASTQIYIRGVGSSLDFPMIEPPNAYNINGVYIPREVSSASIVDVERIEVLPGPQGTLYGRGALGGVINTVVKRPTDEMETKLLIETGNYSSLRTTVTQNMPLSDDLRFRGTLSSIKRDGYMKSNAGSQEDLAAYLSFDYSPSDAFSAYVWGHFEQKDGSPSNLVSKGSNTDRRSQRYATSDPWDDRLLGSLASYATLGPIEEKSKVWSTSLIGAEINWDINDQLSLTYIPSYLDFDWHQNHMITHKNSFFGEEIEQQTHELRFSYDNDAAITALAGLYAYQLETSGQLYIQFGANEPFPGPAGRWSIAYDTRQHELKGIALFGELTYELSDTLRVALGGRVSEDEREANGYQPNFVQQPTEGSQVPISLFSGAPVPTWENEESWNNVDWKVGIEYDIGAESLLYATIQTGFQPGTFDNFPDAVTEESNLLAFTAGTKNQFFDGQLVLNNEFYYYTYDNLLTQAWDAASGANHLRNADVTIFGDQLELAYMPEQTPNTQFKLSMGYLHGRYGEFSVDGLEAYEDSQLQNSPEWTFTFGIIHDFELDSGAYIRADITSRYESGYWANFLHSSGLYQEAYTKTDASLTYHSTNESWTLGLWVRNLENQDVQAIAATGNPVTDPGPGAAYLEPPRTFGLRYTLHLGQ